MPVKQRLYEEWLRHAKLSIKLLTLWQWVSSLRFIQLTQSNHKIQINFTNICCLTHTLVHDNPLCWSSLHRVYITNHKWISCMFFNTFNITTEHFLCHVNTDKSINHRSSIWSILHKEKIYYYKIHTFNIQSMSDSICHYQSVSLSPFTVSAFICFTLTANIPILFTAIPPYINIISPIECMWYKSLIKTLHNHFWWVVLLWSTPLNYTFVFLGS